MENRKKIIVGAWKAYLDRASAEKTALALKNWRLDESKKSDYDIVLSPSFPHLFLIENIISETNIALSAQDVDPVTMGAYTGHIPPQILLDVGCEYVILGHSELREMKDYDRKSINLKVKAALESGLKVILCIGEKASQKASGHTYEQLTGQIESALVNIDEKYVKNNLDIAYEPVWAISSQNPVEPPSPQEINTINEKLRAVIKKQFSKDTANSIRLLYGGSVNANNVCGYLNETLIDGVLVGSASTKLPGFIDLLDAVEHKVPSLLA